jgi:hypothetical protein
VETIFCVLYDDQRYPDGQSLPKPKAIDYHPGELMSARICGGRSARIIAL